MKKLFQAALVALLLAPTLVAAQDFQQGRAALRANDFAAAFREFLPLAEEGDALSQHNLGVMYENGLGFATDFLKAAKWYRLAAEQGYFGSQYNIGQLYLRGDGVRQDNVEALKWYRLAAEQGMASAQYNVGWMYISGNGGVSQDYSEAIRWYRLAANQGDTLAQVSLGYMYANGSGVPKDNVKSHMWYDIALSNGSDQADTIMRQNKVAAEMSPFEISMSWLGARICMVSDYKDCDK